MAQADLGVRVFLIDNLTSPMGLVTTSFSALLPLLMGLSDEANKLGDAWLTAVGEGRTRDAEALSAQLGNVELAITGIEIAAGGAIDFGIFVGLMETAVGDAGALQDTMNQLQISVQGASNQLGGMQQYLFTVANASIYTADQVGQGFNLLGEKGYNAQQIMAGLGQQAINLSEAVGDSSSGTVGSTNLLATAMEVFRAKASDAKQYADLLTYAFYNGIPSVDGLRSAFEQVGGRAAQLKIPIDQIVVSLDMLGRAGMTGQQAGAALNYTLQALYSPTSAETNELIYLGVITANHVSPALDTLAGKFRQAGATMPKFDGTVNSLQEIFKSGQKVGAIPLAATFYQWATNADLIKNAFYDANGNARPLIDTLDILYQHLKGLQGDDLAAAMKQLFNVRSGQGATQLLDQLGKLDANFKKLKGSQDANGLSSQDAAKRTDSLTAAQKQLSTTFTDFMAQVGTPIAGVFQHMLQGLNGFVGSLTTGNPLVSQFLSIMIPVGVVLSGLAVVIGIVAAAVFLLDGALLPIIGIVLLVAGGIMLLAAAIAGLIMWVRSTPAVLQFFQQIGSFLGGAFSGAIKSIGETFKEAFGEIGAAIQPALPALKILGIIIGGLAAIVLGAVLGAIVGAFQALGQIIMGIVHIITGAIQIIMGVFSVIGGIFEILIGMFTLNGDMIKDGWNRIWSGLGGIVKGAFSILMGIVQGTLGAVAAAILGGFSGMLALLGHLLMGIPGGFTQAFGKALVGISTFLTQCIQFMSGLPGALIGIVINAVNGLIHWFQHLFDVIVGHSIIPDMVKSIIMWIALLPIRIPLLILQLIGLMIDHISGGTTHFAQFFADLPGKIGQGLLAGLGLIGDAANNYIVKPLMNALNALNPFQWGANFAHMIGDGIKSGAAWVGQQASNIGNGIKNFLGFGSPTKEGPGSDSDHWMPNLVNMLSAGLLSGVPTLSGAALRAANAIHGAFSSPQLNGISSSFASASASINGGNTTIPLVVDGQVLTQVVVNRLTGQLQMSGTGRLLR